MINLEHRGASGSEKETGDGAGLLVALPHAFLSAAAAGGGMALPAGGGYEDYIRNLAATITGALSP